MKMKLVFLSTMILASVARAQDPAPAPAPAIAKLDLPAVCRTELEALPGKFSEKTLHAVCEKVQMMNGCQSVEGRPIFHYDKMAKVEGGKRILVFSLIHGDETPAGTVGRYWLERLEEIDPRNSWRVVPILNPDGVKYKTRTNANKIDINRNFPTKDWESEAISFWKQSTSSNPRRFPGDKAASEPETKCAIQHIEEFKPDFIVSIHTPLSVLDFDGPKVKPPAFPYLPWKSLGHMPGSLGRYMWHERQTPVLTAELHQGMPSSLKPFDQLQDVIGTLVKLEIPSSESQQKKH
jgi:hypothetical protein